MDLSLYDDLTHLPLDTNPYLWLADYLKLHYLPHYSRSAKFQIYACVGILSFDTLLVLLSLLLRCHKKQVWFFRRQVNGTLFQPNLAFVGGCLGLVILGLTIFVYLTVIQASEGLFPRYLGFASLSLGVVPSIVGTIAIWSLSSSFLVHVHSQDPHRPLSRWISTCNIVGICAPFVLFAIFLPLDIIAGRRYANTVSLFFDIDAALHSEGARWQPSSTVELGGLLSIVPLFNKLEAEFSKLRPIWQANYIFNSTITVLLVVALSIIAGFYFASVRRLISKGQRAYLESGRGGELLDEVHRTWIGLVISMILFLLIAAITFGLSLFSAIRPLILSQSFILASFWSDTVLSVTISGVLLWLSWILEPEKGGRRGGGGIEGFVSFEEKTQQQSIRVPPLTRQRRRSSSIWFEDFYRPSSFRRREESDSTCVDVETFRLDRVEESESTDAGFGSDPSKSQPEERGETKTDLFVAAYSMACDS